MKRILMVLALVIVALPASANDWRDYWDALTVEQKAAHVLGFCLGLESGYQLEPSTQYLPGLVDALKVSDIQSLTLRVERYWLIPGNESGTLGDAVIWAIMQERT